MKKHSRAVTKLITAFILAGSFSYAIYGQTGGGSTGGDPVGGAALIFHKPANPDVRGGSVGESATTGRRTRTPVTKSAAQDRIIAKGNAARIAARPRYSEAELAYKQAAREVPDDPRTHAGLGNVYLDQGRFANAVDAYQQALQYDPDNPEIYNNLAFMQVHAERYPEAVESGQKAIALLGQTGQSFKQGLQNRNEVLSHAYKNVGNAYNGLKKYNEAADALKQAAVIEPSNAAAHFNLGLALYNGGRYSEAIEAYKAVVKLRPQLAVAHYNLGLSYIAINDKQSARKQYEILKPLNAEMANELQQAIR
jgi:Flp pilus assembly protein TadD